MSGYAINNNYSNEPRNPIRQKQVAKPKQAFSRQVEPGQEWKLQLPSQEGQPKVKTAKSSPLETSSIKNPDGTVNSFVSTIGGKKISLTQKSLGRYGVSGPLSGSLQRISPNNFSFRGDDGSRLQIMADPSKDLIRIWTTGSKVSTSYTREELITSLEDAGTSGDTAAANRFALLLSVNAFTEVAGM